MLVWLNAVLFANPRNIEYNQKPSHATTLESLVTLSFLQVGLEEVWISLNVHLVYRTEAHSKIPEVIWHHRQQGIAIGCKLLGFVERCQPDCLAQNVSFQCNKERSRSAQKIYKVLAAHPPVFSKVLAARKTYWITARARKNKRTAHMLASARKDHSILVLIVVYPALRI